MLKLNDEETFLIETVRRFVDREVKPTVQEVEHANEYPEKWIDQMKQIGIYGLAIPEEYGGSPVSMPCYAQVTQELSRGWMSLAGAMGGHTVVAKLISLFGTEEQKVKYLPRMATGEIRATMALTEPGGGSDLQAMTTNAKSDGTDLVVNGAKTWITNARRSGVIALLCKTDPSASPRHAGISIVLVEHGEGLTVSRDLPKLGYKGVESCELSFDNYRISESAILGGTPGKGFGQMMKGLETGRIQVACRALGVATARTRRFTCVRAAARELRPVDLEAPVDRQLPRRHGNEADGRTAADVARGADVRQWGAVRHGGGHGQAVRLRGGDGNRFVRRPHPRRLRLLDGVRRRAVFP
ncbi:acyl-CoA dehydrogenase, C-terminal domain protein' [Rhodococcus erythropolis]|uniref:Acyl-CoA dehydrogenase, C-terminal domain protein n=1 Tax=Rhodococcus erythropolis TaxID=1833 RepID=A0A6G9D0G8_RHOER|nr:acyl-CoA dehydrogenase, C-terminal domain protein' [Rhodococcus erythropolis]